MTITFRHPLMPPEAPLNMPAQDLARDFDDPAAPGLSRRWKPRIARLVVFGFALGMTGALGYVFYDWFRGAGLSGIEGLTIALAMFTFFWIALSVSMSAVGLFSRPKALQIDADAPALDVAMLMPVYGEPIDEILGRASDMLGRLADHPAKHRFQLFVLSDTRDPALVEAEQTAIRSLRAAMPDQQIHYRYRRENTGFKAGNIEDWVTRWGADHDAMLVLDSDSLMSADSILTLVSTLATNPGAGLVQSVPRLIGAQSLFGRMQQFSNVIYGSTLARGLMQISGNEANYWGHNAIIRTRAFAAAAGLPQLPGKRPFGGTILSHDFVEAALIRRAGWSVQFLPSAEESYEGTPDTVIDFVMRDRRWCQGNLQHLRLLATPGLHAMSRFHMFQGAMAYVASVAWFGLLLIWALFGVGESVGAISYFVSTNPLFPTWPDMEIVNKVIILGIIYGMLIAPKLFGAISYLIEDPKLMRTGGPAGFAGSVVFELLMSILIAPMMMVQHMIAVVRTLSGADTGWTPKAKAKHGLLQLARFHWLETLLGVLLSTGCVLGMISLWMAPIAVSLLLAVPLSLLMRLKVRHWPILRTPQDDVDVDRSTAPRSVRGVKVPQPLPAA